MRLLPITMGVAVDYRHHLYMNTGNQGVHIGNEQYTNICDDLSIVLGTVLYDPSLQHYTGTGPDLN